MIFNTSFPLLKESILFNAFHSKGCDLLLDRETGRMGKLRTNVYRRTHKACDIKSKFVVHTFKNSQF